MKYGFLILMVFAQVLQADVYKTINADGEVVFSDQPSQGAERVKLPGLSTYKPPTVITRTPRSAAATKDDGGQYSSLTVSSPEDEATIWDNEGIISLSLKIEPGLQTAKGHRIQYFLDGKPDGEAKTSLTYTYRDVDRGTHTVSAAVVDVQGKALISSSPVTVHVHKASIQHPTNPLFKPPPPPAPPPPPPPATAR